MPADRGGRMLYALRDFRLPGAEWVVVDRERFGSAVVYGNAEATKSRFEGYALEYMKESACKRRRLLELSHMALWLCEGEVAVVKTRRWVADHSAYAVFWDEPYGRLHSTACGWSEPFVISLPRGSGRYFL